MSKVKVYQKKSILSIKNEQYLLSKLRHPFMINMTYSFQDPQNLYIVLDYCAGGDLRYNLSKYKKFNEETIKFIISNIIIILDYLHSKNVIHRDIKPENLVFDNKGYLHLTDFGIAREVIEPVSNDTSGTPGYMAPEVLFNMPHSFSADYYALGVITYELLTGHRPYKAKNRREILEHILSKEINLKENDIPKEYDSSICDFINRLLKRKPNERLGSRQRIQEIKKHPWLIDVQWELIESRIVDSPFIPEKGDNFDTEYANKEDRIVRTSEDYSEILYKLNASNTFDGYYFNCYEDSLLKRETFDENKKHMGIESFSTASYNNTGLDSDLGIDKANM